MSWSDDSSQITVPALAERARHALCPTRFPDAFTVTHVDLEPTVPVGEQRGYRIVLAKSVVKFLSEPRARPTVPPPSTNLTEFVEMVLVPTGQEPATGLAARIPWSAFKSMYHLQTVDMGTGLGFRWFGRMNLWEQDDLRERLGLVGGDDRRALAEGGLAIEDPGQMTRNSMRSRMSRFTRPEPSTQRAGNTR